MVTSRHNATPARARRLRRNPLDTTRHRLPALQFDHREIVAARLFSPDELRGVAVTGPVAAYLEKRRLVLTGVSG
jgi:hypothetical protein